MTDDKPSARTRTKENFKLRVIETARKPFLEKGVGKTSMADLGRVLGVSKPTVYEAYRSKQQLMDAVFNSVADDVDMKWLHHAVEQPRPFHVFLDDTAKEYKRLLETPRTVEAFSLFIREGGQLTGLTDSFLTRYAIPATEASRRVISAAIAAGECKRLDVTLVQKMIDAPLLHVLVDRTLFGSNGMPHRLVGPYIDNSFGALKTQLCNAPGGVAR